MRKEAEIAIAPLTINSQREQVVFIVIVIVFIVINSLIITTVNIIVMSSSPSSYKIFGSSILSVALSLSASPLSSPSSSL